MLRKDLLLVSLVVCIFSLMIIPLAPGVIDILIAVNISISILLIILAVYIKNPSDFSTFPSVILVSTAFRLALSIATTRLILTEAEGGAIIETFGDFVIGGSIAVGLVIFLIITVVQFLVVTKGAERVAEVAARFSLDALPGRQMAIDADLRAGDIDAAEADRRRKALNKESQLFGSMDGAMKFVKGDAIAGLIIILVNLCGGIAVGVFSFGMTMSQAAATFSLLTIGDGLVAQIPALLLSLCAGIIVTRATNPENTDLGSDISREMLADPRVPAVAAVLVLGMGLLPGFPLPAFGLISAALFVAAIVLFNQRKQAAKEDSVPAVPKPVEKPISLNPRMQVLLGKDIGSRKSFGNLQQSLDVAFAKLRDQTGVNFRTPGVEVVSSLGPDRVSVVLDKVPLLVFDLPKNRAVMPIAASRAAELGAQATSAIDHPVSDFCSVEAFDEDHLRQQGVVPVDVGTFVVQTTFQLFERNIALLFGTYELDTLVGKLREADEGALRSVLEKVNKVTLQQVFTGLISDGVPLQPIGVVLDSLYYWTSIPEVDNPQMIEDCMRGALKRQICHALIGDDGVLGVFLVDPDYEEWMRRKSGGELLGHRGIGFPNLQFKDVDEVLDQFREITKRSVSTGKHIAIVISADLRRQLRSFLAVNDIQIPLLAPHEITTDITTFPLGVLRAPGKVVGS